MRRSEVWLVDIGGKVRPGVVLTRSEVIGFRSLVTFAEITTSIRGLESEVSIDSENAGLDRESVVNCDGVHTIEQKNVKSRIGKLSEGEMQRICNAISYAFAC